MNIYSKSFEDKGRIPRRYSCDGESINPGLIFADVPNEARSLALIVDDPDAPSGRFVHWTVWGIDPGTSEIKENELPPGAIEGATSAGATGYRGPCPPSGTHRYFFKLYALDTDLDLPSGTPFQRLESALGEHTVEYAEMMAHYSRE